MMIEVTQQMTELSGIDFMYCCISEHPNKKFREQCKLLRYAVMDNPVRFKEIVNILILNPNMNLIPFYPAKEDDSKMKDMIIVGTILDGRLYLG